MNTNLTTSDNFATPCDSGEITLHNGKQFVLTDSDRLEILYTIVTSKIELKRQNAALYGTQKERDNWHEWVALATVELMLRNVGDLLDFADIWKVDLTKYATPPTPRKKDRYEVGDKVQFTEGNGGYLTIRNYGIVKRVDVNYKTGSVDLYACEVYHENGNNFGYYLHFYPHEIAGVIE